MKIANLDEDGQLHYSCKYADTSRGRFKMTN